MNDRTGARPPGEYRGERADLSIEPTDPDAIREEIRRTRSRMSGTVEELGERLNPDRVKHQVKQSIHDATIGKAENMARVAVDRVDDTRHSIMDNIRDNPVPAAMVGIGLGWLFLNGRKDHDHYATYERTYPRDEYRPGYYGGIRNTGTDAWGTARGRQVEYDYESTSSDRDLSDRASEMKETARERGEEVVDRAMHAKNRVREQGEQIKDRAEDRVTGIAHDARDMASDVSDRAHDMMEAGRSRGRETASQIARQTRQGAHRVEDRFEDTLRDNPLAIGAAAVAIGLAVGLSAPSTRRESEIMGGARDQLVDKARHQAHDAADRAKSVASRVADEAQSKARDVVDEVKEQEFS